MHGVELEFHMKKKKLILTTHKKPITKRKQLYLNRFNSEWLLTVTGEHANKCVQNNLGLEPVRGCAFDENIPGVESDLGVVAVDDGRQR